MSAVLQSAPGDDAQLTGALNRVEHMVVKVLLAGVGLALGSLAGIVIGLASGLIELNLC